ncbi:hypothetical protein [Psychroserpens sp.]|uniref:hypothetical protein n=1 Tax=Psychroserpens sp. TaxID=2020870 RepID=UPI002B26F2E4|nr:hypothetical protein [Psychroserpens sp.]
MKTLKTFVLALFLSLIPIVTFAQDDQAFLIHQDQVKPGMVETYEAISKEFNEECKKLDFKAAWSVAQMVNGKYLSITPIKNLGDIDNMSMAELSEKMGKEKFKSYFDRYNKCYDKHGSYVTILSNDLSYMPDGMSTTQEGMNYRKWHIISVTPENRAKMAENMKVVKDLFVSKKSKMHYRVYTNGFGQIGDSFIVVVSAKNELDMAQLSEENRKLLGPESKAKFDAVFNLASDYEEVTGGMRPDLSYSNK